MGLFGATHGWETKKATLPNICHTCPVMIKFGTIIPYLKRSKKHMNHVAHPLSSADISIFSPEINNHYYIKKYRYKLHFNK